MGTLEVIDAILQNIVVRWTLLASTVILLGVSIVSVARLKATNIQLDITKSANSEYLAAAKVAESQRNELEIKVKSASEEIKKINTEYNARIAKLSKTRIISTACADMVAESVRLLQEGTNETAE